MPPSDIESRYRARLALRFAETPEAEASRVDELVRKAEDVLATAASRARSTVEAAERSAEEILAGARREAVRILAAAGSRAAALREAAVRHLPAIEARAEEAGRTRGQAQGRHQAEAERRCERAEVRALLAALAAELDRVRSEADGLAVELALDLAAKALDLCRDRHVELLAAACGSARERLGDVQGVRLMVAPGMIRKLRSLAQDPALEGLTLEEDPGLRGIAVRLVSDRHVLLLDAEARLAAARQAADESGGEGADPGARSDPGLREPAPGGAGR